MTSRPWNHDGTHVSRTSPLRKRCDTFAPDVHGMGVHYPGRPLVTDQQNEASLHSELSALVAEYVTDHLDTTSTIAERMLDLLAGPEPISGEATYRYYKVASKVLLEALVAHATQVETRIRDGLTSLRADPSDVDSPWSFAVADRHPSLVTARARVLTAMEDSAKDRRWEYFRIHAICSVSVDDIVADLAVYGPDEDLVRAHLRRAVEDMAVHSESCEGPRQ